MLKSTLGLAVLLGGISPATADDKSGRAWTAKFVHPDAYVSSRADQSMADAIDSGQTGTQNRVQSQAPI
ncbi:MAG TPA: hypothetical protein VLB11_05360 [Methyloceanibacter sp.]|nr:hypothetical protein [Methyloceanibacter sp.]